MGYRPAPRFTYELKSLGLEIRVTCWSCKHTRRVDADHLSRILVAKGRSQALFRVGEVMRCSMCGKLHPEVVAKPIADDREMAEERRMARS